MNKKGLNILFLTVARIDSIAERGIYTDLLRKFIKEGHHITMITPSERRYNRKTQLIEEDGAKTLRIKTLNIQKTNAIEKGIGTLLLEKQFNRGIKKYLAESKFDLILYSTPPITLSRVIKKIKKRDNAGSYLLLKDIFPQNAVDLGMFRQNGLLHSFFRNKEKDLYEISDYIGCMSPENVNYLRKHNPGIPLEKIEICPNSIEIIDEPSLIESKKEIRKVFNIPEDVTLFLYGGNLGKPQGISFLEEILKTNSDKSDRYFLIVGGGTEYSKLEALFNNYKFSNAKLIPYMEKSEYDRLMCGCDVGLIFLDNRFTIPNYPSRLLNYMEHRMPILAATDENTDVGKMANDNGYGFWCKNGDVDTFNALLERFVTEPQLISKMGENSYNFLTNNYTVDSSYNTIISHFN